MWASSKMEREKEEKEAPHIRASLALAFVRQEIETGTGSGLNLKTAVEKVDEEAKRAAEAAEKMKNEKGRR